MGENLVPRMLVRPLLFDVNTSAKLQLASVHSRDLPGPGSAPTMHICSTKSYCRLYPSMHESSTRNISSTFHGGRILITRT